MRARWLYRGATTALVAGLLAAGCRTTPDDPPTPDGPPASAPAPAPDPAPVSRADPVPTPAPAASDRPSAPTTCHYVKDGYGPTGDTSDVRVETVADGLRVPWGLGFLPGGELLVTERAGRVRRVVAGSLQVAPVATVPVTHTGEGGLLGLALHPQVGDNGLFYVYYTADAADGGIVNRVARYRLAADRATATLDRVVLDGIPAARFHNGGRIDIGPDSMLYVGTGDARVPALSQRRSSLAGKLLRVTLDGTPAPGNPWPGSAVLLSGIRNTQGWDYRADGSLIMTDHGPSGEIAGRTGHDRVAIARQGQDLGWPTTYGCEAGDGFVTSSLSWVDAVPPGGAAVYTGAAIPRWRGSLFIGTLRSKHLHRVWFSGPNSAQIAGHEVLFRGDAPRGLGRIRTVRMGPDGHLYATTSNCDGRGRCGRGKDRVVRFMPR